jgi:hypothetical protein
VLYRGNERFRATVLDVVAVASDLLMKAPRPARRKHITLVTNLRSKVDLDDTAFIQELANQRLNNNFTLTVWTPCKVEEDEDEAIAAVVKANLQAILDMGGEQSTMEAQRKVRPRNPSHVSSSNRCFYSPSGVLSKLEADLGRRMRAGLG